MTKNNLQFWLIYSLAWMPYAFGYIAVFTVQSNIGLGRATLSSIHNIFSAAILGVGVIWICRRFSPQRRHQLAFLIAQIFLALCYAAFWNVLAPLSFSIEWLLRGYGWTYSMFTGYGLQWQFFAGLMIYATVASIVYTLEFSQRARAQEARALRAEHLKTEAELNALRAQLNPHFLFNTLHSLMSLVRTDSAAAENAIERLAALLRYSLKTKNSGVNDDVSLFTEWKFVENYLALERLRLGERLKVEANLPPITLNFMLPAFTLQSLVENAVKHAVAPNPGGALIKISAGIEKNHLKLEIVDDGAGTSLEKVFTGGGTGLTLVRQRLKIRHPHDSEFTVETSPNDGFRVFLLIPQEDAFDDEEDYKK